MYILRYVRRCYSTNKDGTFILEMGGTRDIVPNKFIPVLRTWQVHGSDEVTKNLQRMGREPQEDGTVFWEDVVKDLMSPLLE